MLCWLISLQASKTFRFFGGQYFDFLITVCDEAKEQVLRNLSYGEKIHYSIPDPAAFVGNEEEKLEEFRRVREIVKKRILRFIGGALYESTEAVA